MSPTHAIVMADPKGVIRHWDAGAETLFGYAPSDALGASLDLLVPEEFRKRHWTVFRRAADTHTCKLDGAATNLPVRCKDGEVRVFPARFVCFRGAREAVVGFAAIYSERAGSEAPFGPIVPL